MVRLLRQVVLLVLLIGSGVVSSAENNKTQLFLSALEVKAGKSIVEKHCVQCHGFTGISETENIPHLAGQHMSYLFTQMKAYQKGTRVEPKMRSAIGSLSDEALIQAAGYYSSMEPRRIPEDAGDVKSETESDPLESAKTLSAACAACHGPTGNGSFPGMPLLTGNSTQYLATVIRAYKTGTRQDAMMQMAVSALTDEQIDNLALYYALQDPKPVSESTSGNAEAGKAISAACASCHGEFGVSHTATPSLAGQDYQYLVKASNAYKTGARNHALMKPVAESLSEQNINDLAAYYSSQQGSKPNVRLPLGTEQWAEKCDRCHGYNGNSSNPDVPVIAGQREDYLVKALTDYKSKVRENTMMHAMSEPLGSREIKNLAAYYSSKQGRAVIFIQSHCQ